jgi:hypothetical protein
MFALFVECICLYDFQTCFAIVRVHVVTYYIYFERTNLQRTFQAAIAIGFPACYHHHRDVYHMCEVLVHGVLGVYDTETPPPMDRYWLSKLVGSSPTLSLTLSGSVFSTLGFPCVAICNKLGFTRFARHTGVPLFEIERVVSITAFENIPCLQANNSSEDASTHIHTSQVLSTTVAIN